MATATDILSRKGYSVVYVAPQSTVLDAVTKMNLHGIGALVVMDEGRVLGIFTERDVLKRVVGAQRSPDSTTVGEVMTSDVISVRPDAEMDDIGTLMRNRRIRHIPVCEEDGDLLGLISIGDINACHTSNQEATIQHLSDYIYGRV